MPVLEREEYIEQAYFFHAFRERLVDGLPSQEILRGSAKSCSRRPSCRWPSRSCTSR